MKSNQKQEYGRAAKAFVFFSIIFGVTISQDRYPIHWHTDGYGVILKQLAAISASAMIGGLTGSGLVFLVAKIRRNRRERSKNQQP